VKLPNSERCLVERQKIVDYLLNPAHPENGGKADFFTALGFDASQWEILASSLRQLAASADVSEGIQSVHGQKFIIDGPLNGATGRVAEVRTVWIVDTGSDVPRLVTAYPNA